MKIPVQQGALVTNHWLLLGDYCGIEDEEPPFGLSEDIAYASQDDHVRGRLHLLATVKALRILINRANC